MTKKDMRLQFSGYMIFAAKMVSVATALIFQYWVAHAVNKVEYDLWFNITDLTGYFTLLAGVLPFWVMRFATRDKEGAIKTGIIANLGTSAIASVVWLISIPVILSALGINTTYLPVYFLASLQIVELYSTSALEASLQARIPQTIGYGLIIQQIIRVTVGYVLIFQFGQLLMGAVAATISGCAVQLVYYFKLIAPELKQKIRMDYIREWLKGSVGNIYNVVGNQMAVYIFIMLFAYGGEGARGKLGAASIIVNVITYSSFLAYALYPKLLAERKCEDITICLKMVLMFAVPLTAGAIALANSYVSILRPEHADAGPVLVVLALDSLLVVVTSLFAIVLFGFETIDEEAKISLRQLVRSRMFIAFSLPYLHSAISLPSAFYILTNFAQGQPLQAALCVAIINLTARLATFSIQYSVARKATTISIPWKNIAKYVLAASAMAITLYLAPHPAGRALTLMETAGVFLETVAGGAIYIALLMLIDKEARRIPKEILREFRKR